jgi:cation transport ATPase
MSIRFSTAHKRWLYCVFTTLWLSGITWLLFHYFMRTHSEFGEAAHPLEIWWLRLHGLAVFFGLVAAGSVLPVHARRAWQLRKNRASGLGMKLALGWLAATGYSLYYFASESNETWLPLLHWSAGLALPLLLVFHIRRGRVRHRQNRIYGYSET